MPDSAIPVQHSATILKFDRIEAAGSVLTGSGVEPFWTGYRKTGRSRLCKGTRKTGEIRVLKKDGSVENVIPFDATDSRP